MPSSYSGETIGQESLISPVHSDVNNVYSTAKMEAKCNAGSSSNSFAECTLNYGATLKLESVNSICVPFMTGSSSLAVSIEGHDFNCLLDSGAAVTAISAEVWHTYLSHAYPSLDRPSPEGVTSVNGCRLATLGKSSMKFVIDSQVLPFEAHVIQDLAYDVILGRDFLQKFSFKIDFENGVVNFSPEADPLPFSDDHSNSTFEVSEDSSDNFISSVHASRTFVIPPQSEILVSGKLNSSPNVIGINGMIAPRSDLSHRYSVFGAAELVRVAEDGTIPIRIVNPSSEPVKIYRRTKLASFEEVDQNIAAFEVDASEQIGKTPPPGFADNQFDQRDYSKLPDLSDSVVSDDDKIKFENLFRKYRDVFALSDAELGRTSLVQYVIDTGDTAPIKQRPYRTSPENKQEIDRQVDDMLERESFRNLLVLGLHLLF